MSFQKTLKRQLPVNRKFAVQFISLLVGAHGIFILGTSLLDQVSLHHVPHINSEFIDVPLFIGLSLLYLSTLLRRRKRTAWIVTVLAYSFYVGLGFANIISTIGIRDVTGMEIFRAIVLPAAILLMLFVQEKDFVVHSDIQGFRLAARFGIIMLVVALFYGVTGFSLLDNSDFHQEIAFPTAIHYTIDQFDLTTNKPLHPYTKRAKLFVNSLSFVSIGATIYVAISLFQPLRLKLSEQSHNREIMKKLLSEYGGSSEDFFKLWPHDKQYFFDETNVSGLAFHVYHGVALCLGDPAGQKRHFTKLLTEFDDLCFSNDWLPAFIHVEKEYRKIYEKHHFILQKIGQEAVLDLEHFETNVTSNKYFRNIRNKFVKQDYTAELLLPPHHDAVIDRLQVISNEWLSVGGRVERGFAMGYFTTEYMQDCPIMVARDAAGTIQAFINQLPIDFQPGEASFDLLRHTKKSLGNINDFLLLRFIEKLRITGYVKLNMGLCPLIGLNEQDEEKKGLIDGVLRFAYANGDRFYSFSGLYRFKAKYEPEWRDRYIAYQMGVRGFSRTTNALMRTMRVKLKKA
jgi:phosphatidylglycerol lysyltransferase